MNTHTHTHTHQHTHTHECSSELLMQLHAKNTTVQYHCNNAQNQLSLNSNGHNAVIGRLNTVCPI